VAEDSYSLLCRDRDHAAYSVVGVAEIILGFWDLKEESEASRKMLQAAIDNFDRANDRITEFHESQVRKQNSQSEKENQSDGNATAA
jgi:hypothetical protein